MTFEEFRLLVPKIKKMSVPGTNSHFGMAPELRKKELLNLKIDERKPRNAAVMMLLYPKKQITHLSLILRPVYEGVHSGQVALPGGKVETYDENYRQAALRETEEEVGVPPEHVEVIKQLTKIYIPPSNFWVHPYMGVVKEQPTFRKQESEVAEVIEVPVQELLNEGNVAARNLTTSYASNIEVPAFVLKGYTVWGATAMMLNELKTFLNRLKES